MWWTQVYLDPLMLSQEEICFCSVLWRHFVLYLITKLGLVKVSYGYGVDMRWQKYMAAKGEWRQSCCQADCILSRTRWPLRTSVVHHHGPTLPNVAVHSYESWADVSNVLMSMHTEWLQRCTSTTWSISFSLKHLPVCYIIYFKVDLSCYIWII